MYQPIQYFQKRHGFFQGLSGTLAISPVDHYRQLIDIDSTPEERIRQTWERVGSHLYAGIAQYDQQRNQPNVSNDI
jgi:hypothetical protein